jgi:hypothetical protein
MTTTKTYKTDYYKSKPMGGGGEEKKSTQAKHFRRKCIQPEGGRKNISRHKKKSCTSGKNSMHSRNFKKMLNTFDGLLVAFEYYQFATSLSSLSTSI